MSPIQQRIYFKLSQSPLGPVVRRVKARIRREDARLLFFFTGATGEWPGMGHQLYGSESVFRDAIDQCSSVVEKHLDFEIASAFSNSSAVRSVPDREGAKRLGEQERNIVMLAALQIAQCDLWRSYDIVPDGTLGMSLGESLAAYAAGGLTLEDSMRVACAWAEVTAEAVLPGKMIFLDADYHSAIGIRQNAPVAVDIFGAFSPITTLLFVAADDYAALKDFLDKAGMTFRAVNHNWTYHTSRLPFERETMKRALHGIQFRPTTIPFYSCLTASRVAPETPLDWLFWHGVLSRQCRLSDALQSVLRDGYNTFINMGARPASRRWIEQNGQAIGRNLDIFDSMRHNEPEETTWREAEKAMRARGVGKPPKTTKFKARQEATQTSLPLFDSQFVRNPYPFYAGLRQKGSVHHFADGGFWLVLGYDEVLAVLKQADKFSSSPVRGYDSILAGVDPPEHTRTRRIVARYFSASRMQGATNYANATAHELLGAVKHKAEFDAVSEFAVPLSERVMGHFLGMAEDKVTALRAQVHPFMHDAAQLLGGLRHYFQGYVKELQVTPLDDFCSQLIVSTEPDALSPEEIASLMTILWIAGTHTTSTLIPESLLLLAANPEIRAEIQANSELVTPYIEESLRLSAPVHHAARAANETTTIGGVTIPAGGHVKLCIGAANRDPAHFPDPDRVWLQRNTRSAVMFGSGIHRCVGSTLARVETRAVLEALFEELPDFQVAEPLCAVPWAKSLDVRSLESVAIAPR